MIDHAAEIKCQYKAFTIILKNHIEKMEAITKDEELHVVFRSIITWYGIKRGKTPDPKVLIFIAERKLKRKI